MQLHLSAPPAPDSAPRFAAAIVAAAADISDAELDYGPAAIETVEEIVDGFRSDGATAQEMAESLVAFGCYVGETLIRQGGGSWRHEPDAPGAVPLVVEAPDGRLLDPIDWVFRRLEHGADVSIRDHCSLAFPGPCADR
ncbi:DUF3806 domain-containing protein [Streptomyces sp. CRN 30]|uniref:DUF3806 domain-containing protein n=1 Tax=Streptomyces sp. CRN 30 TaxID=3075613 RepID=UPI002A81BB27|nr:DUF3806 domain-containing protein [Streptomyces sp. CRN 30]